MRYQLLKKEKCKDGYDREVYAMPLENVFGFVARKPDYEWSMGKIEENGITRNHYDIPINFNHWVFLKKKK